MLSAVPRAFVPFAAAVMAAAVPVALLAGAGGGYALPLDPVFGQLAMFVALGELLPIHVPRRAGHDWLTVSSAFGLAVLLLYGLWPAIAVYVLASVLSDVAYRTRPAVLVFNAAQYVVALAAGAAVISLGGAGPIALAAGAAFFAVNQLLAGTGGALLAREPVVAHLRRDAGFHLWAAGLQIALAPLVVAATETADWLVPLAFCPLVAVYLGGSQSALNGHRAAHDALTGLPHRLPALDAPAVVLAIAVDDGGTIRRTLGHGVGERLLAAAARRLEEALDDSDALARVNGSELGLLRRGDDAATAVRDVRAALAEPFEIGGLSIAVQPLIGAAAGGSGDPAELLARAELAQAAARETSRAWSAHGDDDEDRTRDRLALATQLRAGLDRGELVVHYQLKVPLWGERTVGVEALVRWDHPQLGRLGPDAFIDLAERTGLIAPLTDHVLAVALRDTHRWLHAGHDVRMAVNLSTELLADAALPARVSALLEQARVPAARLQLEVTEQRPATEGPRAATVLEELRALGVTLAIDDFGAGFSSLVRLRRLPVTELKIDKSFVLSMLDQPGDLAVVRAAIDLGRELGLDVVAEGVEDEATLRRLSALGCDYAQGHLFGAPAPAAACERRLRAFALPEPAAA